MRSVYFSFHYDRDNWRVSQVRNSWLIRPQDRKASPFLDKASWEEIKKKGDENIKYWINKEMNGTSVTVVLIGAETSTREWVGYEIKRSHNEGKGLLGIYIHNLKNSQGSTDIIGSNPFDNYYTESNGVRKYLSSIYPTYDWVNDRGYDNIASWIEIAAKQAGK